MTWQSPRVNRIARRLSLLIVLALVALPLVPAHAGDATFSWNTRPVTFTKDGVKYKMVMAVFESANSAFLSVVIFKQRDPAGVVRNQQQHQWSFSIDPDSVDFNRRNLSRASINTGSQLGDFGMIDLDFSQNADLVRSCRGNVKRRAGRVTGTFNFDTNTDFGTVTKRPARADLLFSTGANCGGGGGGGGNTCPKQSRSVNGVRVTPVFDSLGAFHQNGANSSSISLSRSESISDPAGSVSHLIIATVPAGNVSVANNLGSATVEGAGGTDFSGTAEFTATGDVVSGPPTNCKGGKEFFSQSRPGTLSGDLMADFFIGDDFLLSDGDLTGNASKLIVRNR